MSLRSTTNIFETIPAISLVNKEVIKISLVDKPWRIYLFSDADEFASFADDNGHS